MTNRVKLSGEISLVDPDQSTTGIDIGEIFGVDYQFNRGVGYANFSHFYRGVGLFENVANNSNIPTSGEISMSDFYNAYFSTETYLPSATATNKQVVTPNKTQWMHVRSYNRQHQGAEAGSWIVVTFRDHEIDFSMEDIVDRNTYYSYTGANTYAQPDITVRNTDRITRVRTRWKWQDLDVNFFGQTGSNENFKWHITKDSARNYNSIIPCGSSGQNEHTIRNGSQSDLYNNDDETHWRDITPTVYGGANTNTISTGLVVRAFETTSNNDKVIVSCPGGSISCEFEIQNTKDDGTNQITTIEVLNSSHTFYADGGWLSSPYLLVDSDDGS